MSEKLTNSQLREAKIRMEGEHAIKRKIKDKIMRRNPKGPCAYCGKPSEGRFSIHRDGFCDGPEVPLCNECGDANGPNLDEIWRRIRANRAKPVMDADDELARVKTQNDSLQSALARATDQIIQMHKRNEELESALKAKLF